MHYAVFELQLRSKQAERLAQRPVAPSSSSSPLPLRGRRHLPAGAASPCGFFLAAAGLSAASSRPFAERSDDQRSAFPRGGALGVGEACLEIEFREHLLA